jgi:hypothetical protein
MLIPIPLVIILSLSLISDVQAQGQMVTVHVLIEGSAFHDCHCDLCFCDPKIYWEVDIDGVRHSSKNNPIVTNVAPFAVNKDFPQDVDISKQNIPIVIAEYDKSCFPSSDSLCDLYPGDHRRLYLNLDLGTCQISGDATGVCNTSITTMAGSFKFKISIEEPPHAAGLTLRCLHDPIWPQPGDAVTITAEALDGNANPMTGIVDDIEIWVDNTNSAAGTTATTPGSFGARLFTFNHTPAPGANQILYRCRVRDNGLWVSSGWRIVQIGAPATGRAVPILYTGVQDSRVDIAFIADRNDYTGPYDSQFLADVETAIRDAYYAADATIRNGARSFLFNQDAINFWIALDTGIALDADTCTTCNHVLPPKWNTDYSFADSGAIVHSTYLRDFAQRDRRIFSVWTGALDDYLHELSHSPIGLSDEYCCDSYYFESHPYPNIYSSKADCLKDALAATVPNPCQPIENPLTGATSNQWLRVEDAGTLLNDLMVDWGDHTANPADERQLNWYFDTCRNAVCTGGD